MKKNEMSIIKYEILIKYVSHTPKYYISLANTLTFVMFL